MNEEKLKKDIKHSEYLMNERLKKDTRFDDNVADRHLIRTNILKAKLEGFQKGKLEERNRIEDLIIDMRFKIQNKLNNYFNIDTRTLLFIYNKELSQLQVEIGDESK